MLLEQTADPAQVQSVRRQLRSILEDIEALVPVDASAIREAAVERSFRSSRSRTVGAIRRDGPRLHAAEKLTRRVHPSCGRLVE